MLRMLQVYDGDSGGDSGAGGMVEGLCDGEGEREIRVRTSSNECPLIPPVMR